MLIDFGTDAPGPRPPTGGTDEVRVVRFDSLTPMVSHTFHIPHQFITRNSQIAARDFNGDHTPDILILSQDTTGHDTHGEPIGSATLFGCSPTLGTPSTCVQSLLASIPASADGRYPTSLAVADFDKDGTPEVVLGYGSSCQTTSLSVSLFHPGTGMIESGLTLERPFQHVAAEDLDADGVPELVATAGGQPGGGAGALQVYHFDIPTRTFKRIAEVSANLPDSTVGNACAGDTLPDITFEPVATAGLVKGFTVGDFCDGKDNDGDGQIDEDCFLRFLLVPYCFTGDQATFQSLIDQRLDYFLTATGLDACPQNVYRQYVPVGQLNLGTCGAGAVPGTLHDTFVTASKAVGGPDIDQFTAVMLLTNDTAIGGAIVDGERVSVDMVWVKAFPPGGDLSPTGRIRNQLMTFTHELGHVMGLDEEYCRVDLPPLNAISGSCNSPTSINLLEGRLGCAAPPSHTCCNITDSDGYCEGNIPTDLPGGRCIMSYDTAGANPGQPPAPRAFCEDCLNHIKQKPPTSGQPFVPLAAPIDCSSAYPGNGPLLDISIFGAGSSGGMGGMGSGGMQVTRATFVDSGRPSLSIPRTQGTFLFKLTDAVGTVIYSTAFEALQSPNISDGGNAGNIPAAPATFHARIMLPPGLDKTAPLPATITRAGTLVSKVTLNGHAPVASAGPDRTVECSGPLSGVAVLDGTGSHDDDGDTLSYVWSSSADVLIANPGSAMPTVTVPFGGGARTIALEVTDGVLTSAPDLVQVTVQDTTRPVFGALATANAATCTRTDNVTLTKPTATDVCDPAPTVTGVVISINGVTANVTIPSNGRVTLPPGHHQVRWTARDASGNIATATQFVDVRSALQANGTVDIGDRAQVRAGTGYAAIGNSGTGLGTYGVSSQVGELLANGSLFLRSNAHVHGNATTAGTITKQTGVVIDGVERQHTTPTLPAPTAPTVTFPTPSGNLIVPMNGALSALPGSYGVASVDVGGVLTLSAGDYFVDRLILQSGSTLRVDQTAGAVRIFSRLELTHRGTITTIPAGGDLFVRYDGTAAAFLEAAFTGSIVAPQGKVVVRKPYNGTLSAHDIQMDPDVVLQCGVRPPPGGSLTLQVVPALTVSEAGAPSAGCAIAGAAGKRDARPWSATLVLALALAAAIRKRARR